MLYRSSVFRLGVVGAPVHRLVNAALYQGREGFRIMAVPVDMDRDVSRRARVSRASAKRRPRRRSWNVLDQAGRADLVGDAFWEAAGVAPTSHHVLIYVDPMFS